MFRLSFLLAWLCFWCYSYGELVSNHYVRFVLANNPVVYSVIPEIRSDLTCGAMCSNNESSQICSGFQVVNNTCFLYSGVLVEDTSAVVSTVDEDKVGFKPFLWDASGQTEVTTATTAVTTPTTPPQTCSSYPDFQERSNIYVNPPEKLCLAGIPSAATFPQAQADCAARGAILAFPDHNAEIFAIQDAFYAANSSFPEYNLWMGLVYNNGTRVWDGGRNGQSISSAFQRWEHGQPDPTGGKDCVIAAATGSFWSTTCSGTRHYVCEKYDVTF